jgi:deoxyribose-phosphate aldolase
VCVRPADVARAAAVLRGSDVAVGTVVGFPHGSSTTATKAFETSDLISSGAQEIDMVIDIGRLRGGDTAFTRDEIAAVVRAAEGRPVKVIFENFYLTDQQKVAGYQAAEAAARRTSRPAPGSPAAARPRLTSP